MDKSASEQNGHDCCDSDSKVVEKPSSSRKSSYLSGIVAGILACLCCCLPVVALAVGLATIQNVAWLQRYHTALEVVSWIDHNDTGCLIHMGEASPIGSSNAQRQAFLDSTYLHDYCLLRYDLPGPDIFSTSISCSLRSSTLAGWRSYAV